MNLKDLHSSNQFFFLFLAFTSLCYSSVWRLDDILWYFKLNCLLVIRSSCKTILSSNTCMHLSCVPYLNFLGYAQISVHSIVKTASLDMYLMASPSFEPSSNTPTLYLMIKLVICKFYFLVFMLVYSEKKLLWFVHVPTALELIGVLCFLEP